MMNAALQISEGATVTTPSGGENLGSVSRLVVDPRSTEITHLVVKKGLLSSEERIIPISDVVNAVDDAVRVGTEVRFDDLEPFEVTHHLPLHDDDRRQPIEATASPFVWMYPTFGTMSVPTFTNHPVTPQPTTVTERNVPDDAVVIEAGVDVVTADGEKIGTIAGVSVGDDGDVVAIDIDRGWFREDRSLPAHVIDEIDSSGVKLAISAKTLAPWQDA